MAEPKVRFIRDDGSSFPAWQTVPMSEVFTEISEKNHPEMPVLSVQQGVGTVLRDSSDRNILYDKANLKGYKAMKKDDFIIHLRSFEGGLECSNYDGISSPAYRILRPQIILPAAYRDYFRSYEFIRNKLAVSVVGIRDGKNIDMDTFWQIPMVIPCLEEQQKIADFLSSVDEVIAASELEVANLETQKKAVMKKIFSQEVRFKREDGTDFPEWEEDAIGNVFKLTRGYVLSVPKTRQKQDAEYKYPVFSSQTKNDGRMGYYNEYLYEDAMTWTTDGANAGTVKYRKGKFYCTNVCGVLLEDKLTPNSCLAEILNIAAAPWVTHNGNPKLMNNVMAEIRIRYPSDIEEQRLIADFLSDFDEAIAAAKKELELWKELKKGLLQQMFV